MPDHERTAALADALLANAPSSGGDHRLRAVEVGIGERAGVAEALVERGAGVIATDVVTRTVPDVVEFRRDDLLDPDVGLYRDADLVYALRLPAELHRSFARLANEVDVPAAFTTLGGDPSAVDAAPEQLAGGETLHWLSG